MPVLVVDGKPVSVPQGSPALAAGGRALSLSFTAFDLFAGDTFTVLPTHMHVIIRNPDKSEIPTSLKVVARDSTHFAVENIAGGLFAKGDGVYYLKTIVTDKGQYPNSSWAQEPVVRGCVPPEIQRPSNFAEVAGTVTLFGTAKDPDWVDNIRFSHYEIEYQKVELDAAGRPVYTDAPWETDGMCVPTSYRTGKFRALNVSETPVSEGSVLGYWNTTASSTTRQGYYLVRLLVFDRFYHPEITGDPLALKENAGHWAADTVLYYVYNDASLQLSGNPVISLKQPREKSIDMREGRKCDISYDFSDNSDKLYDITLELRDSKGRVTADTVFKDISGDNTAEGAPTNFNRLGYFIYRTNDTWHIRWNNAGTNRVFKGMVSLKGAMALEKESSAIQFSRSASSDSGISIISWESAASDEIVFSSSASHAAFTISTEPAISQDWVFTGKSLKPVKTSLFSLSGGAGKGLFTWNGKNKYGFFPAPDTFTIAVMATGKNGFGFAEDTKKVFFNFPFGISIAGLSDTLFEVDISTSFREVTVSFRPVSECRVSCRVIDAEGMIYTLFCDSSYLGRGSAAEPYAVNWNFNANNNELVRDGLYRFVLEAVQGGVSVSDTSDTFRLRRIQVKTDPTIAMLDVVGDTSIQYDGASAAPVVNGKSDYRWMAKGEGKSYADIPFTFDTRLAGQQAVQPHGFERFTIKARRGFKKLNYQVRMYLECGWFQRETWYKDRNPKTAGAFHSYGETYATTQHTDKLHFTDTKDSRTHGFTFSAFSKRVSMGRDKTFYHGEGLPRLWVYFLPENFNGRENVETWNEYAWEVVNINCDNALRGGDFKSSPLHTVYKNKFDDSFIDSLTYSKIDVNQREDYTAITGSDYSQFYVRIVSTMRRHPSWWSHFFDLVYNIEFGTNPDIWDPDFTRHGFNSLVNRYATWDSDNSIFYSTGDGVIAKDGFDNDFKEGADNKLYSIASGNNNISEDQIKWISDIHAQAFDFSFLKNNRQPYFPFYFSGLEGDSNASVVNPFWEFKLCGNPDNGKYGSFAWAYCDSGGEKKGDYREIKATDVTSYVDRSVLTKDNTFASVKKFRVEGDNGKRCLMVWCRDPAATTATETIQWPLTPLALEAINNSNEKLLHMQPAGFGYDQTFIPPFGAGVRYGIHDGLDRNSDGDIDPVYMNPGPESLATIISHLNALDQNATVRKTGVIKLDDFNRFQYEYVVDQNPKLYGNNVSPYGTIESYNAGNIPLAYREERESDQSPIKIIFTPKDFGPNWSTSYDPQLARSNEDFNDSLDNNKNLEIDESATGYIISDPVAFNKNGFATANTVSFSSGYPKDLRSDSTQSFFYTPGAGFSDNAKIAIDAWDVSLRYMNGEPNKDLIVSSISSKQGTGSENDALDCFTVRLKDNVFVPRKIVAVNGIAKGGSYTLMARDKNGWKKLLPVVGDSAFNTRANKKRTLGYWDVSSLNGCNTLVLQVKKGGSIYQAQQTLLVGQLVDSADASLYSTHSRARLDIPGAEVASWQQPAVVSMTARTLEDLTLLHMPNLTPVGPIMEIQPSPIEFKKQRPKLTVNFTYNEAKINGWLDKNFNLYTLNGRGEMDIVENSVTTYYATNDTGERTDQLPGQLAFKTWGERTDGKAMMQIAAEVDHWSAYAVVPRKGRVIYVKSDAPLGGNGRSWKTALRSFYEADSEAFSGDTIKIAAGTYPGAVQIKKNLTILGGFNPNNGSWIPWKQRTIFAGDFSIKSSCSILGVVLSSTCAVESACVAFERVLFTGSVDLKASTAEYVHCTFADKLNPDTASTHAAFNTLFLSVQPERISVFDHCAAKTWKASGIVVSGDPLIAPDYSLTRVSPLIDACARPETGEWYGRAPDIGFYEFWGDTLFVSATRGNDANKVNSIKSPVKTLGKGVALAQQHDCILVTAGIYTGDITLKKTFNIFGGCSDDFSLRDADKLISKFDGTLTAQDGGLISGLHVRAPGKTGITMGAGNCVLDSMRITGCEKGIEANAEAVYTVVHTLFNGNAIGIAIPGTCSLQVNGITCAYNGMGLYVPGKARLCIRNTLFYRSRMDLAQTGKALITYSHNVTYGSAATIPCDIPENITTNPRLVDPEHENFYLESASPCLRRGENSGIIGAFGRERGLGFKTAYAFALNEAPAFGGDFREWTLLPGKTLTNRDRKIGSSRPGFSCIVKAGYFGQDLFLLFSVTGAARKNDSLCFFLANPMDTSQRLSFIEACKGVQCKVGTVSNTTWYGCRIPLTRLGKTGLKDRETLLYDFMYIEHAPEGRVVYSFNGPTSIIRKQRQMGYLEARDLLTPKIRIQGVRRYANEIVRPVVLFDHALASDSCVAIVNGQPLVQGQQFWEEKDYRLEAKIIRDSIIADTIIRFTIDITPPKIKVHDLPPDQSILWTYAGDYIPYTYAKSIVPAVIAIDARLKRVSATLNGRHFPVSGKQITREGLYVLLASATDSAGNQTDYEQVFKMIHPEAGLAIFVTSHADQNATNQASTIVKGWVNSSSVSVLVNDDTVKNTTVYFDSTAFSHTLALEPGDNQITIKAFSKIQNKPAFKAFHVSRDTIRPIVTVVLPANGDKYESNLDIWDIPVSGSIVSGDPITSCVITSQLMSAGATVDAQNNFSGLIGVRGEDAAYHIRVVAQDVHGNRDTVLVSIVIGHAPDIIHQTPQDFATINTVSARLQGKIYDENMRALYIQYEPALFSYLNDTAVYDDTVTLPIQGSNRVVISAVDSLGFVDSLVLTLYRDNTAPSISITSPVAGSHTGEAQVTITGNVDDPTAIVFANSDTCLLPHGTTFSIFNYALQPGPNLIIVQANDTAGNSAVPDSVLIYRDDTSVVYVDNTWNGVETGSSTQPFNTLFEGVTASWTNGTLVLRNGPYNEAVTFKDGMRVYGENGLIVLNADTGVYTLGNNASFSNCSFTGSGANIVSGSGSGEFAAANCVVNTQANRGFNLAGYRRVSFSNTRFNKDLSGHYGVSASNCDTLVVTDCRFDTCGQAGLSLSAIALVLVRNALFTGLAHSGVILTDCQADIQFSTFAFNLSGVSVSRGQLLLKNSIQAFNQGYAINQSNAPAISAIYNCLFSNGLGNSQQAGGIDLATTVQTNPMFSSFASYELDSLSQAKNAGENGSEMGYHGHLVLGRRQVLSIVSPPANAYVKGCVSIMANANALKPGYSAPELCINGKCEKVLRVSDETNDNVWARVCTDQYPAGQAVIKLGAISRAITIGLPPLVREEKPMPKTQTCLADTSGNLIIIIDRANNRVVCTGRYSDTLYSFGGFGKDMYKFDAPTGVKIKDSVFTVYDAGNNRAMTYTMYPVVAGKSAQQTTESAATRLTLQNVHFIPSPFKIHKEKGYIRYNLNKNASVTIIAFDRLGRRIRDWDISSGMQGGRVGVNEIRWDGKDQLGAYVASGVYVFRVVADSDGDRVEARVRMAVIGAK